jgi:hypothetical protein
MVVWTINQAVGGAGQIESAARMKGRIGGKPL